MNTQGCNFSSLLLLKDRILFLFIRLSYISFDCPPLYIVISFKKMFSDIFCMFPASQ